MSNQPIFQRRSRHSQADASTNYFSEIDSRLSKSSLSSKMKLYLAVFSVFCSLFNLLLANFLPPFSSLQSENLYTAFMMTKGTLPYSDSFATGGLLYYILYWGAYSLGSLLLLLPIQIILNYFSGLYLVKIVERFSVKESYQFFSVIIFYLSQLILGLGGLYPSQLALPFITGSLWLLLGNLQNHLTKDELFILYGLLAGLAVFTDPKSLLYYIISLFILILKSWQDKNLKRGIYQLLAIIFGFLIIFYSVGYILLNLQLLSDYTWQTLFYENFTFGLNNQWNLLSILVQFVLLVMSGLVASLIGYQSLKEKYGSYSIYLLSLIILVYSIYSLFNQTFELYSYVNLLPFGVILLTLYLANQEQLLGRRSQTLGEYLADNSSKKPFKLFISLHFGLPILVLVYALIHPLVTLVNQISLSEDRQNIVKYLKENTIDSETIYTWDDRTTIYMKLGQKSSSKIALPTTYTGQKANKVLLEDDLNQDKASYIIVNNKMKVWPSVKQNLEEDYEKVTLKSVKHFTVYQKK